MQPRKQPDNDDRYGVDGVDLPRNPPECIWSLTREQIESRSKPRTSDNNGTNECKRLSTKTVIVVLKRALTVSTKVHIVGRKST